ncbi:1-aminocyclopropane-1-carboxylate synthase-like protein 1 [Electrophorus electricus]|uniref:1-aminocyclopropane-1-carboxylate synthase-like protein 1 n=1 Tax=Electrophorus electricus TaxID=8005 RepID=UPI0015D0BC96|nr:1-aminocyclopropane-1-carboxylate synthase-like protein 1 [Electrophorus electricus]
MDFHGKKYERGSNWSEPEVVELLQLWSDEAVQNELESCLRNQHVFNRIAVALHGRGIYRTGDQCREKIKKLKLEYRRIKENQKTLRGGRAWKFYEVIDRVLSNRATSSSYCTMWGSASVHQVPPGSSSSEPYSHGSPHGSAFANAAAGTFMFHRPPNPGELLEVKREDLTADEELLSCAPTPRPELLYQIGSEDEHDADSKSAGPDAEEFGEMARGGGAAHAGSSPSAFSEHNVAGSSGTGVSPATAAVVNRDRGSHSDTEDPKGSGTFRQRKRRRAGRAGRGGMGGSRLLESALAGFLSWQRVMEERYLSLEEARLQQEVRAEERREQQEERRAKQEREHELRLLSIFAGALTAVGGGTNQDGAVPCTDASGSPSAPAEEEPEPVPAPEQAPSPQPAQHPSPGLSTVTPAPGMLWADQALQLSVYLSGRGNNIRRHQGILQEGYTLYYANQHDESCNPGGIINMGTSENKLCFDLLKERLAQPDMLLMEPCLLQYPDWKGHRFLREEVAKFLSEHCCPSSPLDADNVVVMNGCGSLFCAVAAVLCDPDDAILIPTPFYGVITEDVSLYSGVKLYHVPLDSKPLGKDRPFHLTAEKLDQALQRAKHQGVNVRALVLINPHNPLGEIYTSEEMNSFLKFAKEHVLHVIVDEIYMLSVFGEDITFHSVLSLDRLPDPQRTHVIWGLSKDFAMAGVRVGVVYSENTDLVQALDRLGNLHGVGGPTQHQVALMLRDHEWVNDVFLPENRRRLREAHGFVSSQLTKLGIPYLHRGAGFFIWADFSKYLKEHSFTEELRLWRCFLTHRVLLSCGQAFSCSSPGWFRIVFSDQQRRLQLGLERIRETLEELQGSSSMADCEGSEGDVGEGCRPTETITETEGKSDEDNTKDATSEPFSTPTIVHCGGTGAEAKRSSLADEDFGIFNGQSSSNSESLDSLIGALRRQIHSSNWLEKNRPELAPGEDLTQMNVFKDLLDRARM